ncbi:hypothetical protein TWF696_007761 [Orbilia brochopaga]|uniref:Uncharacterized protein n=1 Tax=Orbilia brochopaga TaxID=3140254 RepID=A0AAV9UPU0_9PEZI
MFLTGVFTILQKKSPSIYRNLKSISLERAIPRGNPPDGFRNDEKLDIWQLFPDSSSEDTAAARQVNMAIFTTPPNEYPTKLEEITVRTDIFDSIQRKSQGKSNFQLRLINQSAGTLKRLKIFGDLENKLAPRDSAGNRDDLDLLPVYPTLLELEIAVTEHIRPALYLDIAKMFPNLRVLKVDGYSDSKTYGSPEEMVYPELMGLKELKALRVLWPGVRADTRVEMAQVKMSVPQWIERGLTKLESVEFWNKSNSTFGNFQINALECEVIRKGSEYELRWGEWVDISDEFSEEMLEYTNYGCNGWTTWMRYHHKRGVTLVT